MKSKAAGCGSISTVNSSIVLMCVNSIIIIITIIIIIMIIIVTHLLKFHLNGKVHTKGLNGKL